MLEPSGVRDPELGSAARAAGPRAGRTFVILNPAAGGSRARALRRRIKDAFAALGEPIDMRITRGPGHASELAREAAAQGYRAVTTVGGDGTLAEVAAGLAGTDTPLAIVPRGTANQVAANLGIPTNIEAAVKVAVTGHPVAVDVGSRDGRIFTLAAGAGFDAAVMARATPALKERLGFAAYLYSALWEAVTGPRTLYRITADGRELHVEAMSVLVANVGALYATFPPARMPITPEPDQAWRDGQFDVLILEPVSVPAFAGLLARLVVKGFGGEGLLHLNARDVLVESDPIVPVQIDGDPAGTTPLHASIIPGALRILVPDPLR